MTLSNITFVVFTFNEEKRIERVIKNFQKFGKILLADNNSTDRTQEIAKAYGCDIFLRKEDYVFVEDQRLVNQLYNVVTTDWIYWAFADEMLDLTTLEEIEKIVTSNDYDVISMDRKNYFYGKFCYDVFSSRTFKLFKKGAIDFTGNTIHNMGRTTVDNKRIYKLPDKYFIHHFISNTAQSYLNVINRYTDQEPTTKFNTSPVYVLLLSLKIILKQYIINGGYKCGFSGLSLIQLMIFYGVIKNIKQFEKNETLSTSNIEDSNNVVRDKILSLSMVK